MLRGESVPIDDELQRSKVKSESFESSTQARSRQAFQSTLNVSFAGEDFQISLNEDISEVIKRKFASGSREKDFMREIEIQKSVIKELRDRLHRLERVVGPSIDASQFFPDAEDSYLTSPLTQHDDVSPLTPVR